MRKYKELISAIVESKDLNLSVTIAFISKLKTKKAKYQILNRLSVLRENGIDTFHAIEYLKHFYNEEYLKKIGLSFLFNDKLKKDAFDYIIKNIATLTNKTVKEVKRDKELVLYAKESLKNL